MSMSNVIRNVKDLNTTRTEVLQSLLRSLGRNDDGPSSGATLSTEQLQKLSEKIKEVLGDDEDRSVTLGDPPYQLQNEDGLPIVDISEHVDGDSQTSTTSLPVLDQDLISHTLLPPDERERQRRERDRVLDLLEEEERLQQLQEERDAEEERKEAIGKRRELAEAELEQVKVARQLQKRMGHALVQHARRAEENGQNGDPHPKSQSTPPAAKKCVSFAEAQTDETDHQTSVHQPGWGDVTPGRLRAQGRVPLVSKAETQKYPIQMRVVERHPTGASASSFQDDADSDDEPTSSARRLSPRLENDSSLSNNNLSDNELLEDGFDIDTAQHHREIALEYYEKRHAIGTETAEAMGAHVSDDRDQQETSPLSRFRADRMAAAYDKSRSPVSTSIGQTSIPSSRQKSLRSSVRLGRLENNQLVGEESGESGSEDETIREVIQMMQTGNIWNVGPDFEPSSTSAINPQKPNDMIPPSIGSSVATHGTKLSRGRGFAETIAHKDNSSGDNSLSQPVVSSVIERKAPKSLPNRHFPLNKPPPRSPIEISQPASPMTTDSPSFSVIHGTSPVHLTTSSLPSTQQTERSSQSSARRRASKFVSERTKTID